MSDEGRVRAMVALLEAQASQIQSLRESIDAFEARASLREALDRIVADEVDQRLADLRMGIAALRRKVPEGAEHGWLWDETLTNADWLSRRLADHLLPPRPPRVLADRAALAVVRLADLVDEAVETVPDGASRILVDAPEQVSVTTAPTRVTAILGALLDNAVRHGGGLVECRAEVTDGDVIIRVIDRGRGLNGADPESLFSPLHQGHGLGLFVVRMLARSLGGEVTLAERPTGGTVAMLKLPQQRASDVQHTETRHVPDTW